MILEPLTLRFGTRGSLFVCFIVVVVCSVVVVVRGLGIAGLNTGHGRHMCSLCSIKSIQNQLRHLRSVFSSLHGFRTGARSVLVVAAALHELQRVPELSAVSDNLPALFDRNPVLVTNSNNASVQNAHVEPVPVNEVLQLRQFPTTAIFWPFKANESSLGKILVGPFNELAESPSGNITPQPQPLCKVAA